MIRFALLSMILLAGCDPAGPRGGWADAKVRNAIDYAFETKAAPLMADFGEVLVKHGHVTRGQGALVPLPEYSSPGEGLVPQCDCSVCGEPMLCSTIGCYCTKCRKFTPAKEDTPPVRTAANAIPVPGGIAYVTDDDTFLISACNGSKCVRHTVRRADFQDWIKSHPNYELLSYTFAKTNEVVYYKKAVGPRVDQNCVNPLCGCNPCQCGPGCMCGLRFQQSFNSSGCGPAGCGPARRRR